MVRPHEDERLTDWVDGRLSERERERLEAEFRVNPELDRAASEYRRFVEALRGALREDAPAEVSADLTDRIMAGVAVSRWHRLRPTPWLGSLLAAAAIVLIYVGIRSLPGPEPESIPAASHEARPDAPAADRGDAGPPAVGVVTRARAKESPGLAVGGGAVADELRRVGARELEEPRAALAGELADREVAESELQPPAAPEPVLENLVEESVPVVVIELPADTVLAGRAGLRDAAPAAEDERDDRQSLNLFSLLSEQLVRTPMAQQRADADEPGLRLGRVQQPEAEAPAPEPEASLGAMPADSAVRYEARPGDQLFELRGDREQVGAYLRRLADLGRQSRAAVQVKRLDAVERERLGQFEVVDLTATTLLDAPESAAATGQPRGAKKDFEAKSRGEGERARASSEQQRVILVVRRRSE